jgi:hypothetical protein
MKISRIRLTIANKLNTNIARYKNVLSRSGRHKEEKTGRKLINKTICGYAHDSTERNSRNQVRFQRFPIRILYLFLTGFIDWVLMICFFFTIFIVATKSYEYEEE